MRRPVLLGVVCLLTAIAGSALADGYGPLPTLDGSRSPLQMQIVGYRGGTNGEMVVKVRNPTAQPEIFTAHGLYFVPEGDPERAPQRLGAAGPFVVLSGGEWKPAKELPIPPLGEAELRLQVFCIDSHRASPSPANAFRLGSKRLPKTLRNEIEGKASGAIMRARGDYKAAKSAIQSEVWGARDKKWIELDGERRNEKAGKQRYERRYRPQRFEQLPQQEQRIGPR
jgi:hypothetical protein